ncbi:MAG: bifunctional aldolase/short-chain dehydrogenase [Azospirillum sp.]|nr:bifunctional aldolase/short-chain dehydrogenase [Azospirillum sp.]
MDSRWSGRDADSVIARYAERGVNRDLALRVYTSRLLGQDPRLVLHGGGNTSVKTVATDLLGDRVEVLCVKGSGWDMAAIEPAGLPAVRLAPLLRLRGRDALSDEDMVNLQRLNLLDSAAPNPSVETLLHAFLPHRFIDHTHAVAVLAVTDQPDGEARIRDLYGDRVAVVPYIMPGFALAKAAAAAYEASPGVDGMILLKHGIFSFGDDARDAYERMIALVSRAEDYLSRGRLSRGERTLVSAVLPERLAAVAAVAPVVRGALALPEGAGAFRRWVLEFRNDAAVMGFINGRDLARYAQAGVATPDHVIRTKGKPLLLAAPAADDFAGFAATVRTALADYHAAYQGYFARNNARQTVPKKPLDPVPRVVLVPGLGLFGVGKSAEEASVAADIAEAAITTITDAEVIGRFESIGEADLFDMEYWSLEQAKLGRAVEKPLARQVVAITGGAGAIGRATAAAFLREGAEVALLDLDGAAVAAAAQGLGKRVLGLTCDVTDAASVRAGFDRICQRFGGLDIVVSNAGAAWQGKIGDLPDELLRRSFELNFFAHQTVAQNAVRVMRAQGTGGCLLFNVSKQAVNPGPDFGAYGLPKAATLFLSRQYALDHGGEGIRANAVNADRIRSGLLTEAMIAERSRARGLDEAGYMTGNLLGREVTAEDVAQAFVHQALALKTTAGVTTVDGGNIAAALR